MKCYRCKKEIIGIPFTLNTRYFGKECAQVIERRSRMKAQPETNISLCVANCTQCVYLSSKTCPVEDSFKGLLGRRR